MKNKDRAEGANQRSQTGPDGGTEELPLPRVHCIQSNSQSKVEMKCVGQRTQAWECTMWRNRFIPGDAQHWGYLASGSVPAHPCTANTSSTCLSYLMPNE